jgi:hypothetical protein
MANGRIRVAIYLVCAMLVGFARVPAASADVTSPAGPVIGGIIVFPAAPGAAPAVMPSISPIALPRGGLSIPVPPALAVPGPTISNITLLTPTPATGSVVVPLSVPPASGSGPSFTRLQLVIPGPNPAQNTTVALQQMLNSLLAPQPAGGPGTSGTPVTPVTVFAIPSR